MGGPQRDGHELDVLQRSDIDRGTSAGAFTAALRLGGHAFDNTGAQSTWWRSHAQSEFDECEVICSGDDYDGYDDDDESDGSGATMRRRRLRA